MKSDMCVLFSLLIMFSFISDSSQYGYSTIAKTVNNNNNKMEKVIDSYQTPLKLHAVDSFSDNEKTDSLSSSSSENMESRFKAVESLSSLNQAGYMDMSKMEIPTIVPYLGVEKIEKSSTKSAFDNTNQRNLKANNNMSLPSDKSKSANGNEDAKTSESSSSVKKNSNKISKRKQDDFIMGFDVDLQNRINDASLQTISNKDAFNAIYPDPQTFKDKVSVKVFDPNYEQIKGDFMKKLNFFLDNNLTGKKVDFADQDGKFLKKNIGFNKEDFSTIKPEDLEKQANKLSEEDSKVTNLKIKNKRHRNKRFR